MKSTNLALKKGRGAAGHNIALGIRRRIQIIHNGASGGRYLSNKAAKTSQRENPAISDSDSARGKGKKKHDQFSNRDFFLSVLESSATKREARAYLKLFTPPKEVKNIQKTTPPKIQETQTAEKTFSPVKQYGVNLGSFYGTRAVHESPRFVQQPSNAILTASKSGPLHVALVKIRAPQLMDDDRLAGVAKTLSQLAKLGLTSTVVVDCSDSLRGQEGPSDVPKRIMAIEQVDRVVAAIDECGEPGARKVDNIIGISEKETDTVASAACVRGRTHVMYRKLLMTPLRRGVIPVIAPVGYTKDTHRVVSVKADDVVLALTREFAGFHDRSLLDLDPKAAAEELKALRNEISLDRLIVLDPLGGIPTGERPDGYHVFLNLEQEFGAVKTSLLSPPPSTPTSINSTTPSAASDLAYDGQTPQNTDEDLKVPTTSSTLSSSSPRTEVISSDQIHLQNLELARRVLSLLPPTSSALITTPMEAANSGKQETQPQAIGVGTRRQRNPLIHNLLTDKPVYSSSLPAGRLGHSATSKKASLDGQATPISPTTFVKRGVSVSIFPDPRLHPWQPCLPGQTHIRMTSPSIDLPRLVHLIDDSFNRTLDVPAYLARVNSRIAGIIIAGEYEGAALLTWETPPGVPDDGSAASRARMVPYLDKFAVLKRSQGAGGVADIVFKAMVRDCFPQGVCWRSRRDNPVNKWYFERSRGTWEVPGTGWTMFWTTEGLGSDSERFGDYEGVCRGVEPSWADGKGVVD